MRVFLNPCEPGWCVRFPHTHKLLDENFKFKVFALAYAIKTCRRVHEDENRTVSLNVRGKDGKFQEERTYGLDPSRTPG